MEGDIHYMQHDLFRRIEEARPALEIGHQRAEDAAEHAGEEWREGAYVLFLAFVRRGLDFTTEEVQLENPDFETPPDKRAWGQVAKRAKRAKLVKCVCYVPCKSKSGHGHPIALWRPI